MDEPVADSVEAPTRAPEGPVGPNDRPATARRRRRPRSFARDVGVPLLAISTVLVAIFAVQYVRTWRADSGNSGTTTTVVGSDGFTPIKLGVLSGGDVGLGKPAPAFQLEDLSGRVVTLADFRGKPVVVNFWATWCVPCRKETPDLVDLQREWGASAQIVGVNYSESAETAGAFANEFSINYVIALDRTGEVTGSYKLTGLPETFFLDQQGLVRDHRIGLLRPGVARCIVSGIERGQYKPDECR